jgi:hypothetical protein
MRIGQKYSAEFKADALALMEREDHTKRQLAIDLGLQPWTVRDWYNRAQMAKKKGKHPVRAAVALVPAAETARGFDLVETAYGALAAFVDLPEVLPLRVRTEPASWQQYAGPTATRGEGSTAFASTSRKTSCGSSCSVGSPSLSRSC